MMGRTQNILGNEYVDVLFRKRKRIVLQLKLTLLFDRYHQNSAYAEWVYHHYHY